MMMRCVKGTVAKKITVHLRADGEHRRHLHVGCSRIRRITCLGRREICAATLSGFDYARAWSAAWVRTQWPIWAINMPFRAHAGSPRICGGPNPRSILLRAFDCQVVARLASQGKNRNGSTLLRIGHWPGLAEGKVRTYVGRQKVIL